VETDRGSTAVIPTRLVIEYPAQKVRMTLMLSGLSVNQVDTAEAARALHDRGRRQGRLRPGPQLGRHAEQPAAGRTTTDGARRQNAE